MVVLVVVVPGEILLLSLMEYPGKVIAVVPGRLLPAALIREAEVVVRER
jgi:hypothetical protein